MPFSRSITKEKIVFDLEIGLGNKGKIKQEGLKKFSSSEGRKASPCNQNDTKKDPTPLEER
ncbi:hypothetical protein DLM76_17515 [Leptospira yasudae]|uniref:Uncharacterized protein n=1 Tax=Leptospira yasudae TaxID=2202201 RepID=A0ABX9LZW7_9LEPT|nr:hypothetical protein DLM77_15950 [Leptospira yasudae]RHX91519.1 hypothetical protein DLM76_17515 [Leptospira yasudae]